ncbi:batten's disease protein Cln3, partial [Tribonema minus]
MTFLQRVRFVGSLWPYMAPLCVVYFAEYCMQSGTWSAIGFPITSEEARRQFYLYANWMYQVGVFISRSSGILVSPPRWVLQLAMPAAQVTLLVFFYANATHHWWYDYTLLLPCLAAGLLGGGVYVGTFILLAHEAPRERRELALSAASIADTVGICFADVVGLVIQACVYKANGVPGATAQCPL